VWGGREGPPNPAFTPFFLFSLGKTRRIFQPRPRLRTSSNKKKERKTEGRGKDRKRKNEFSK
jgi:hypothetical protein